MSQTSNVVPLRPGKEWVRGQADRALVEMFLTDHRLPALAAGTPRSDVDNLSQAIAFLLTCGLNADASIRASAMEPKQIASLALIGCELAEEFAYQLEIRGTWETIATVAISLVLEPVIGGYAASQVVFDALNRYKRMPVFRLSERNPTLLARRAWSAIRDDANDVSLTADLIAIQLGLSNAA